MSRASAKPTLAFFGATGGCAGSALALSLKAGYTVHALARTPAKLTKLMRETHSVPDASLDSHLNVIEGSISDANAVRNALLIDGRIADIIVFGIGAAPQFNMSVRQPVTMDNPHVCATGMQAIVDAADEMESHMTGDFSKENTPLVVAISTTGVSRKKNDVPMFMGPLYHWGLSTPHKDKRKMEEILASAMVGTKGEGKKPFGGVVAVRPSLLTDGQSKGLDKVKVGWESVSEDPMAEEAPAVGYTISRADVGAWIFSEIIQNDTRMQWAGRAVTMTH